mmetsp:Transcript_26187/g.40821  ORF Transcript_26187/g.40821 Transcript_26187/m.40821 type:complete len:192 (-) Transcript_26187:14-589(-)
MKIVLLSLEGGVGKSRMAHYYMTQSANGWNAYDNIHLEECYRKNITVSGDQKFIEILDAGQPESSVMRNVWIREGTAFIIVFSSDTLKTEDPFQPFDDLLSQIERVKDDYLCSWPIVIVENKIDLNPGYDFREGVELAQNREVGYMRTSAATGENINELFENVCLWGFKRDDSKAKDYPEFAPGYNVKRAR